MTKSFLSPLLSACLIYVVTFGCYSTAGVGAGDDEENLDGAEDEDVEEEVRTSCTATKPTCSEDEYCSFGQDNICGDDGSTGQCLKLPEIDDCPRTSAPVCTCTGFVFDNDCFALVKSAIDIRFACDLNMDLLQQCEDDCWAAIAD